MQRDERWCATAESILEFQVSRVFLEVRESNAGAITFYRGLGFQEVGTRREYYQDPKEAATVMELLLRKSTNWVRTLL